MKLVRALQARSASHQQQWHQHDQQSHAGRFSTREKWGPQPPCLSATCRDQWKEPCQSIAAQVSPQRYRGPASLQKEEHAWICAKDGQPALPAHSSMQQILNLCEHGKLSSAVDVLPYYVAYLGSAPLVHVYVTLMEACTKARAFVLAKRVHGHYILREPELIASLGERLVAILAKCGALKNAYQVFCSLQTRTVLSWTAMISGFTEHGRSREALHLFHHMEDDRVKLNQHTYVSLLKACAQTSDSLEAEKLHLMAERGGFLSSIFLGSTLVSTYGKCGCILQAEQVFNDLPLRNWVTWSALLSAYVEQNQGEKALRLYRQMKEEHVGEDQLTLVPVLQACCIFATNEQATVKELQSTRLVCLEIGRALHADARKKGFTSNVFITTTLVTIYGKFGSLVEAENVFFRVYQYVVSWNALISAYVEQGQCEKALQLYAGMQGKGVDSNEKTLTAAIQACYTFGKNETFAEHEGLAKIIFLPIGKALHSDALKNSLISDVFLANTLLSLYGRFGCLLEAENVFNSLSFRDTVSWSAMLSAYVEQAEGEKALLLFRQMHIQGVKLNQKALAIAVKACSALIGLDEVGDEYVPLTKEMPLEILQALHSDARRKGLSSDVFLCNTLACAYGRCGSIQYIEHLFLDSPQLDVVIWSALLSAYVAQRQGAVALQLYKLMQEEGFVSDQLALVYALQACCTLANKDFLENVFASLSKTNTVSWNAMLSAYIEQEQGEKAMLLYRQMQEERVLMNHVTFLCALQACSEVGSLDMCRQLHFNIIFAGHNHFLCLINTLIRAYGSCESMLDAQNTFDGLHQPALSSWNACIAGYAQKGDIVASTYTVYEMLQSGVTLDEITFLLYLSACSHGGLVNYAIDCYESVTRAYGVPLNTKHYIAVVDLLGRAGDFDRVGNLLLGLPKQSILATWLCLLGMCSTHGNLDLAKQAFGHAVSLKPNKAAVYVMMSNIYRFSLLDDHANELEPFRA